MSVNNIIKHLLPNSRAFKLYKNSSIAAFFGSLNNVNAEIKTSFDDVFSDMNPQLTRNLEQWEKQFNINTSGNLSESERRDILDAEWKAQGGQSPQYLEDRLRAAGFNVYVHEWWEPNAQTGGGSVNNDVTPVARIPSNYINDGAIDWLMTDGNADSVDGSDVAMDGTLSGASGYLLVNRIIDGSNNNKHYTIPAGTEYHPYFLYIGGETFPNSASIPTSRLVEFEELCLKICPAEQWIGVLVDYI